MMLSEVFNAKCMHLCSDTSDTFASPWTVSHRVPLSLGLPRQEYWRELPFPPPGDPPNPGIETASPVSPASARRFFTTEPPGKPNTKRQGARKKKSTL